MMPLLITALLGGVLGGWTLLKTPQTAFLRLVPWLILTATIIFMMSGRITPLGAEPHSHVAAS
jgi:uncharacterized membrane protein YfcA